VRPVPRGDAPALGRSADLLRAAEDGDRRRAARGGRRLQALPRLPPRLPPLPPPLARGRLDRRRGAVFTVVGLALVGLAPFQAFLGYQLPRIQSGEAFAFYEKAAEFIISRNFGIPGLSTKLAALGVPGMTRGVGAVLGWLYTLVLLALAWIAGRRAPERLRDARIWLGLLSLAALRSPLAPSAYVTLSMLWLLTISAGEIPGPPGGV